MNIATGILFHAVGASCAALCYTPQKKVLGWSWQTYWLAQAVVCWLLMPVIGAFFTIPHLREVLQEAPSAAMWKSFLLGIGYGVGGTAFGIAIRYVGFSLTYAISVGISCVLGTLIPPLMRGELGAILHERGAAFVLSGIALGALGIVLCGLAGRYKERDLAKHNQALAAGFNLSKGLPLCLLAGVLSAVYGFSLDQGQPIAEVAAKYGAGNFQGNVIYIFSNSGAFLSTFLYCLYLHNKEKTWKEYTLPAARAFNEKDKAGLSAHTERRAAAFQQPVLTVNFLMATLTGLLWYSQFFFYGLGHTRMGAYKFSSWAIHMIMLVLFSSLAGLLLKEWSRSRPPTVRMLASALLVLVAAVLILTYGNYLGGAA